MPPATKIATCCYCGARAALILERARHELSCANCGAPLHEMKRLPQEHPGKSDLVRPSAVRSKTRRHKQQVREHHYKRPKRRGKALFRRFVEEAFDVIEDIFD